MSQRVTLKQVAAEACVSYQTVSRVINRKPEVASETRARVLAALETLGYRARSRSQSWYGRPSTLLGVLLPSLPESAAAYVPLMHVVWGIHHFAATRDGVVVLTSPDPCADTPVWRFPPQLGLMSGIIVAGNLTDALLNDLRDTHLPIVVVGYPRIGGGRLHAVHADDEGGAYGLSDHLLALGHRRVGFVGRINCPAEYARWCGCVRAFRDAGISSVPPLLADDGQTGLPGYHAVAHVMQLPEPPTAVVAFSASLLPGIVSWLRENDYRIPNDVSLATFDDAAGSYFVDPPLTSVDLFPTDVGRKAAAVLFDAIEHRPPANDETVLPTRLIVRGSTMVAPAMDASRRAVAADKQPHKGVEDCTPLASPPPAEKGYQRSGKNASPVSHLED